ncbi:hypothetical protein COV93_00015 [Candidatus Woesearchaeota archaeon CG11_big_fil_rev_8_21_14_0_20_43_8]|nr:MAG: hypothetical protein COV93_00015 [Candidatus Woesearchaeota archaeon CG11_big_fil_rev_8_21_14_0_20_43_8]PIO06679.1 MAG: hypothetical protein COT47_03185 [Candidatus Woesearchaeota archaeon CG08_land_8_20_14_0_20_43_7]
MDNITHILMAYLLAVLFIDFFKLHSIRKYVIWTSVIAAIVPDTDIYLRLFGHGTYMVYHRFMNSIFIIPLASYLIYRVMASRLKGGDRKYAKRLFDIAFLSYCVHVFLDVSGSWGDLLLFPFSLRKFHLDMNPIVDIFVLLPLVMFFIISMMTKKRQNQVAQVVMTILLVHFGFKAFIHSSAVNVATQNGFHDPVAIPDFINPFNWYIIGQNETQYVTADLDMQFRRFDDIRYYDKAVLSDAEEVAKTNKDMDMFLRFARFPYAMKDGDKIFVDDLRFGDDGKGHFSMEAYLT